jgi:hypothetical protein
MKFRFVLVLCVCYAILDSPAESSAIPMWEFLSKDEKVSAAESAWAER